MIAATSTTDFRVVVAAALLVAFIAVLGYRLMSRDPNVKRTRWGVFVERQRYDDDEPPPEEPTVPHWPGGPTRDDQED